MLNFKKTYNGLILEYTSDLINNDWAWNQLKSKNEVIISHAFHFTSKNLKNKPNKDTDFEEYTYEFSLGTYEGEYIHIPGHILGIKNDVLIPSDIDFKRKLFVAERNISIFGRISALLENNNPIVIGGERPNGIPLAIFEELLKKFPNTTEVNRYAQSRITTILSQYIDGMKDARGQYEEYINKRMETSPRMELNITELKELEIEKYILIRKLVKDALDTKTSLSEKEWQRLIISFLLLIFPKYIKVLENVKINDYYSSPNGKVKHRYIDLALLDANGNLDVIELKRSFENKILRQSKYRHNSIPTSELSGAIMQAEKYLFHLSKWGIQGEQDLTKRYKADIPTNMNIRISNPKAMIIMGRDKMFGTAMDANQKLDFEVIRRKYANIIDIITYDDLLQRIDNTIAALRGQTVIPKR